MRALRSGFLALAAAGALGVAPTLGQGGGRPFNVPLTGAAEVPGPGDPNGSGTAALRLNLAQSQICYELKVSGVALPATGAHIHRAPATASGNAVVLLSAPGADGTSRGCTAVTKELAQEILASPEQFYVNVHTADRPAGALRGQLSASPGKAQKN